MLAVSLYLICFDSLQKTPQTEFAILVVFHSFIFFSEKQILWVQKIYKERYLVFACSSRGAVAELQVAVLIKEEGPKTRVRSFLTSFLSNQILGTTLIPGRDFKQLLRNILEGKQGLLTLVWVYDTITYLALNLRVIKVKVGQTPSN